MRTFYNTEISRYTVQCNVYLIFYPLTPCVSCGDVSKAGTYRHRHQNITGNEMCINNLA